MRSKADEVESKEPDDRSFCGGLDSEGLEKRRRCRHMNAKTLDSLESEEPDKRTMTRKPTKIPSIVDLLKSSDSSNSNISDSPSNEDSKGGQAEDKSHTHMSNKDDSTKSSYYSQKDAVMTPTNNSNETTGTDGALGKNSKATSNCGGSTMMDAQLSHIANATVISSPLNTAQPTSASNKSCKSRFINLRRN